MRACFIRTTADAGRQEAQIARALENKEKNQLTLNEADLIAEREESDQWRLQITNTRRLAKGQEPFESVAAMDEEADGEEEVIENTAGIDPVVPDELISEDDEDADPYLLESGKILLDILSLQQSDMSLALRNQ